MLYILFVLGGLLLVVFLILLVVKLLKPAILTLDNYDENNAWLRDIFKAGNMIVVGKKGKGKDVLFNHVINLLDEEHYANMPYNGMTEIRPISDLELPGLIDTDALENEKNAATRGAIFKNLMAGNITPSERKFAPNRNFYISDAGVFLPSHFDKLLDELFPTLPIHFPLSRQTYQMCIHCNLQMYGRLWKKLREQADGYIFIRRNKKRKEWIELEVIFYEDHKAVESGVRPLKSRDPEKLAAHEARYGIVEQRFIKVFWADLQYDTHYLGKQFLQELPEQNQDMRMPLMWHCRGGHRPPARRIYGTERTMGANPNTQNPTESKTESATSDMEKNLETSQQQPPMPQLPTL